MIGMVKYTSIGLWQLAQNKKLNAALKEASFDTFIGAIIMFPLSVFIIKVCIEYAETTALINFISLTGVAIVRKTLVRLRFSKYDVFD
jgi:hypothetical protein